MASSPTAAAAAKSLQSCPTLCDPIDVWQPTRLPPSLGFSRQERWSGLPFPSPVHESEKWKWSRSVVSDSQRPHGLQPTRLLHPWDFPGKSTGVGCHCLANRGWKVEALTDFLFLGSKITVDSDCSHEIRRRLLLVRKAMTNLNSMLKSRHYSANEGLYS